MYVRTWKNNYGLYDIKNLQLLLSLKVSWIYDHHLIIVIWTTIERWFYYCQYFFFRLFCVFFFVLDNNFILCIINEELKSFYALENTHIYCYNRTANRVLKRLEVWQLHIPILCNELEGQILPLVLQNS